MTAAGEERSVAATKTFTTALAAIAELARELGASDLAARLRALPGALEAAVALPDGLVAAAARSLLGAEAAVCIARGYAYATALEAALKLKEVTGLWAEGFSAADLRHGPRAAALGLPAVVFHAGGPLAADVEGLERELAAAGSPIVSIGPGRALAAGEGLCEEIAPIALIVPAQLAAERLALLRGRDPDRPPGADEGDAHALMPNTLLQLSPHPDDELAGMPATLMALRDAGWRIVNLACGLGRPEQHERRLAELEEACRRAGFELRLCDPPLALSADDDLRAAEVTLVDRLAGSCPSSRRRSCARPRRTTAITRTSSSAAPRGAPSRPLPSPRLRSGCGGSGPTCPSRRSSSPSTGRGWPRSSIALAAHASELARLPLDR